MESTCHNCHEPVENTAIYCGNCGQYLGRNIKPAAGAIPTYALAGPIQQAGEVKALLAVLFGIGAVIGGLFTLVAGFILGLAGVILGSLSQNSVRKGWSTTGMLISSFAVLISISALFRNLVVPPNTQANKSTIISNQLTTPCYKLTFATRMQIKTSSGSCSFSAFNGLDVNHSADVYKVIASKSVQMNSAGFDAIAKNSIEKDVRDNLKGFKITREQISTFVNSPAYSVSLINKDQNVSVVETAVMHKVNHGENVFILVHGQLGSNPNLQLLESQWIWQ